MRLLPRMDLRLLEALQCAGDEKTPESCYVFQCETKAPNAVTHACSLWNEGVRLEKQDVSLLQTEVCCRKPGRAASRHPM